MTIGNESRRILLSCLIALVILTAICLSAYCQTGPRPGDANWDGVIDIVDALLTAQYYVGLIPGTFYADAADVNGNGSVDISDALLIARFFVGIIDAFPGANRVATHDLGYYKSGESYTIRYPFPQAGKTAGYGLRPATHSQAEMNGHCQNAFEDWVRFWVTETGCAAGSARPHMGPGPGIPYYGEPYGTLSEFVGWGMLACVFMDNDLNRTRNLFGLLNNFRKSYANEYGCMMSTINFDKPMDAYARDSAAEADENMAMALLLAHYQWGSDGGTNYLAEATALINDISEHLVERPAYVLKPAATWGGSSCLDPCYYDSIYYPLWYGLTGDPCWVNLDAHYRSLVAYFCDQYGTGLLPDWCKADGSDTGMADKPYVFGWDAHQVSTKWAIHYAWFGTGKTSVFSEAAKMLAAWVKEEAGGDLRSLVDSYSLDGTPVGAYSGLPAMVGALGLAGTVSEEHRDLVNDAYEYLLTLDSGANYNWGNSMGKVVQLLVYSGNFVNITDLARF